MPQIAADLLHAKSRRPPGHQEKISASHAKSLTDHRWLSSEGPEPEPSPNLWTPVVVSEIQEVSDERTSTSVVCGEGHLVRQLRGTLAYRARIRARMGGQPIVRTILECIREK
jgi:hypothetical protein